MEHENTEVQRLSEEGICSPDAIAAVTDTYLKDRAGTSKLTQGVSTCTACISLKMMHACVCVCVVRARVNCVVVCWYWCVPPSAVNVMWCMFVSSVLWSIFVFNVICCVFVSVCLSIKYATLSLTALTP